MKDFTYWKSWFDNEYPPAGNDRYYTFKIALNLFLQKGFTNIVETGTVNEGDVGAGASTIIFGKFLKRYGGTLHTVDISHEAMMECKKKTLDYMENILYWIEDSVEFLKNFKDRIDFLYLDSVDYPLHEGDPSIQECQEHQLKELEAAYDKVIPGGIILLDDNMLAEGGKAKLSKKFLEEKGDICVLDFQQSCWLKK